MRPRSLSLPRRLGLAWLVWVVLLLPVSQSFAAWHEVSHSRPADAAARSDTALLHKASCERCLAAAAVDHGGLPTAAPSLPAPDGGPASVAESRVASASCAPITRYLSRAPPTFLR